MRPPKKYRRFANEILRGYRSRARRHERFTYGGCDPARRVFRIDRYGPPFVPPAPPVTPLGIE